MTECVVVRIGLRAVKIACKCGTATAPRRISPFFAEGARPRASRTRGNRNEEAKN